MAACCLCLLPVSVLSQGIPSPNYYDIKAEREEYFRQLVAQYGPSILEGEGSEYASYKRWQAMWEPRVAPHGDFDLYFDALKNWWDSQTGRSVTSCNTTANNTYWNELGPRDRPQGGLSNIGGGDRGAGMIKFVNFYPSNTQYMLAGSWAGGLFMSKDGGATWVNTDSDNQWLGSGCTWATFATGSNTTIYAASCIGRGNDWGAGKPWLGPDGGIWRGTVNYSTMTVSWTPIAVNSSTLFGWTYGSIQKVMADPNNATTLYVAAADGIYRTTNSTAATPTWTNIHSGYFVNDLEFMPGQSPVTNVIYASTRNSSGIWEVRRTTDGGSTWSSLGYTGGVARITIEVSAAAATNLYVSGYSNSSFSVCANANGGSPAWTNATAPNSAFGANYGFCVDPFNASNMYCNNGIEFARSTNAGSTWSALSAGSNYHVDVEYITGSPSTANEIWICTHGGLTRYNTSTNTWTSRSNGLGVAEVTGMNTSYTDPDKMGAGLYHDGTVLSIGDLVSQWPPDWNTVYGGDGFRPLINFQNPDYTYASAQGGPYKLSSTYGGTTYSSVGMPGAYIWFSYSEPSSGNPDVVFTKAVLNSLSEDIWRHERVTTNDGHISNFRAAPYNFSTNFEYITWRLYNAPPSSDYLYIHMLVTDTLQDTSEHRVYRTKHALDIPATSVRTTWERLMPPKPGVNWISDMTVDLINPDIVYYTYGAYGGGTMVYKVDYTSSTTGTVTDLSYDLPPTFVGDIVQERGSDGALYVCTDVGVYHTNNSTIQAYLAGTISHVWCRLGIGLPHVSPATAGSMELNYQSNKVRIGLSGRGIWEHDLFCPNDYDRHFTGSHGTTPAFHEVQHDITSVATVPVSGNITYRAGNRIVLQPPAVGTGVGFKATNGSYFHAFIHPCNSPGNSFRNSGTSEDDMPMETEEMEKEDITGEVSVYPNPSRAVFFVKAGDEAKAERISVYDMSGRLLASFTEQQLNGFRIDLTGQPGGIYFLRITRGDKTYNLKLSKSN